MNENLEFNNNSQSLKQDFLIIQSQDPNFEFTSPVFNVVANNEKGFWMIASNLGLPNSQISVGFTSGRDRSRAVELANHIAAGLSSKYEIHELDPDLGAVPLEDCP